MAEMINQIERFKIFTLAEAKADNPQLCFYSANTVWWSHSHEDLAPGPVPLDIFQSPLLQTSRVEGFLDEFTVRASLMYGKFPITLWTMAHHRNLKQLCQFYSPYFRGPTRGTAMRYVENYKEFTARVTPLIEKGFVPNLDVENEPIV